jgi:hypothetical protein
MKQFNQEIRSVTDIEQLLQLKKEIKDHVTSPALHWSERMVLYKKVQLINEWVSELKKSLVSS